MKLSDLISTIITAGGDFNDEVFIYLPDQEKKEPITEIRANKDGWLLTFAESDEL